MSTQQWQRDGNWIYELNSDGVNKWTCVVQRGQDDNGKRTSDEECLRIVKLMKAAPKLLDALKKIVKCEENRARDLRHREAWVLVKFSEDRMKAAQDAIAEATENAT